MKENTRQQNKMLHDHEEVLRKMRRDLAYTAPDEHLVTARQQHAYLEKLRKADPLWWQMEPNEDGAPPLWESEEEAWADLKNSARPIEANPLALSFVEKLRDIGSPEDSIDALMIEQGQSWKSEYKRGCEMDVATLKDYTEHGWPLSEGSPRRLTTTEEHNEVMRRLEAFGLTMPGSPEPLIEHNLKALTESELTSPEFLIEGLLRRGGAMLVYGPSGIGKSWFTTTLMLLAASGRRATAGEVLEAGEHKGCKVCLFDGEMVLADIAERARLLQNAFETIDVDQALANITLYSKADTAVGTPFPDLLDRAWHKRLIKHLTEQRISVVVLDNLSTLCPTLDDENSASAWAPFNDFVVALKREGIAVIVVHHASKSGGYRGSSNLVTTLETVVSLKAPEGQQDAIGGTGACFTVHIEKARNNAPIRAKNKTLKLGEFGWSVTVDEHSTAHKIVEMIKSLNFVSQAEIARALDVNRSQAHRSLKKAYLLGLIDEEEVGRKFADAKELRRLGSEAMPDSFFEEAMDDYHERQNAFAT